jgi:WD40 repeat protein
MNTAYFAALFRHRRQRATLTALGSLVFGLLAGPFCSAAGGPQVAIAATPPETQQTKKTAHTDLLGDPLPPASLVRMGTVRLRYPSTLTNVAFSPDGKLVAAVGYPRTIVLYDAATGRKLRELTAPPRSVPAFAFAPDGKTLASAGFKCLQIWDVATAKELRRFPTEVANLGGFRSSPVQLIFSRDGKLLAGVAPDHTLHVWPADSSKEVVKFQGHKNSVRCLAFAADGKTLLSASGDGVSAGSVRVWQLASGKETRTVSLHRPGAVGQPEPLCFSPDGQTLVLVAHEILRRKGVLNANRLDWQVVALLDVGTGEVRRKLEPQRGRFKAAVFSSDGKILATMEGVPQNVGGHHSEASNAIKVWDPATGKQLADLPAYADRRGPWPLGGLLAFAPDGKKLASAGAGASLHVWDLARGREQMERVAGHQDGIRCVAFSPDGQAVATGSYDHTIALWDAATGRQRLRLRGHQGPVESVAFSPDGKQLASASNFDEQTVRLWDTGTGKELRQYVVPSVDLGNGTFMGVTTWVAFAAGRKVLAAGGTDRTLRLWDTATGKAIREQQVPGLRLAPNRTARDRSSYVRGAAFTPDGRSIAFGAGKLVAIVDVACGQPVLQFETGATTELFAFSADGSTLFCASRRGKSFQLVEVASGKPFRQIQVDRYVTAAAFAPDGRTLAVSASQMYAGARGEMHLFDVPTGQELLHLRGAEAPVAGLAFSPDGTKLASGQWDSTALVWDVAGTRRPLPVKDLAAKDLERLWADLKDADAGKAHAARWALVAAPARALALFKERLHPVPVVPSERLRHLIADLNDDRFKVRQAASADLARLGIEAAPALRRALEGKPSPEISRRVQALLDGLVCQTAMTAEALRQVRAIGVLEQIGTPAARQVLASLAQGAPAAPATRYAGAALARRLAAAP